MNTFICFGCQKQGEPITPCTGLCQIGRCDRGCIPTKKCKVLTKKYGHLTTMEIRCGKKDNETCKVCTKHVERKELKIEESEIKMCACDPNNIKPCTCNEKGNCNHTEH